MSRKFNISINFLNLAFIVKVCVKQWACGHVVRALGWLAELRWFEPKPRIMVGLLVHCLLSGGNNGELKATSKGTGHLTSGGLR